MPPDQRHASGDDRDGCIACYFEAVEALLNGDEPVPGCMEPTDDGEGWCANCGHVLGQDEPPTADCGDAS